MKKGKDGRYRTKMLVGYAPGGKPIFKWVTGRTQEEIRRKRTALQRQYLSSAEDTTYNNEIVLGEFAVQWYTIYKKSHVKPTTLAGYRSVLNAHILPTWGNRRLATIKASELQAWLNSYHGARGGTVDGIMLVLRQIFRRAVVEGIIQRDPTYGLVRPHTITRARQAVPEDQVAALLSVAHSHPEGLLLAVLYYTGMRRGEALGLTWGDVDFDAGVIHVRREIIFSGGIKVNEADNDGLKSAAAVRDIPICHQLMLLLKSHRGLPNMPVFPGPESGSWMCESTYRRRWHRLMVAAGLDDAGITAHRLRHTYSSQLRRAGLDRKERQYLLGHADPEITDKTYTHIQDQDIPHIRAKLDQVFYSELTKS